MCTVLTLSCLCRWNSESCRACLSWLTCVSNSAIVSVAWESKYLNFTSRKEEVLRDKTFLETIKRALSWQPLSLSSLTYSVLSPCTVSPLFFLTVFQARHARDENSSSSRLSRPLRPPRARLALDPLLVSSSSYVFLTVLRKLCTLEIAAVCCCFMLSILESVFLFNCLTTVLCSLIACEWSFSILDRLKTIHRGITHVSLNKHEVKITPHWASSICVLMGTGKVDEHKKETSHPLNSVLKGKIHICFDEVAGFYKIFHYRTARYIWGNFSWFSFS